MKQPKLISSEIKNPTYLEKVFFFPEVDDNPNGEEFIIRIYDDMSYTFHFGDGLQIDTSFSNDDFLDDWKKYTDVILKECNLE